MRLIITPRGVCAMPCRQGRYNKRMPTKQKQRKKKEMKTKVTQKFLQLDTHTHTRRRLPSAFRIPAEHHLRLALPTRVIWHWGFAEFRTKPAPPLPLPSLSFCHALFSLRRSLFYNFLIVFAPNLCKIAASRLPSAAHAQIVSPVKRGGGGERLKVLGAQ